MSASIWVRVGGMPATEIAPHGPPTWETWADGGNGSASLGFALSASSYRPALNQGSLFEILCGGHHLWLGRVEDYDRTTGELVGRGIHTDAAGILALTSGGAATRDLSVALPVAQSAPWSWLVSNPRNVSGVAVGDSTDPVMVSALLDEIAQQEGKRWGQLADASLYLSADPTSPMWLATPGAAVFGSTNEGRPTRLVGRFFDGTVNATAFWSDGSAVARTEIRDLTERGTLTLAQANAILAAEGEANRGHGGWVNGVTLGADQLTTQGGTPAALPFVRAGEMMRALGLSTIVGGDASAFADVVIGKTRYTAGEASIYIEPVNTAPRTLVDVIAAG